MKKRLSVPYSEAFEYFLEERQQSMMQSHSNLSHNVVRKLVREEWDKLDSDKLEYYERMHKLAMDELDNSKATKMRGRPSKSQAHYEEDDDNSQKDNESKSNQMTTRSSTGYSARKGKDYYRVEVIHGSKKFYITPYSVIRDNGKRVSMINASQSLIDKANKVRKEQRDIASGVVKPFQEESPMEEKDESEVEEIQEIMDKDGRYELSHNSKIYHVGEKDVLYNGKKMEKATLKKRFQALYRKVKELRLKHFKKEDSSEDDQADESENPAERDKTIDQTYEIKVHKPSEDDEDSDEEDEDDEDESKTQEHHNKHDDKHHETHQSGAHHQGAHHNDNNKALHNEVHHNKANQKKTHHNEEHHSMAHQDHDHGHKHQEHHQEHHQDHHTHDDKKHHHEEVSHRKKKSHDIEEKDDVFKEMQGNKGHLDRHHNTEGGHHGHKISPDESQEDQEENVQKGKRGRPRNRKTSVGRPEKKLHNSKNDGARLSFLIRYAKNCQSRKKGYSIAKENISQTWKDCLVEEEKSNNSKMFDIFMRDGQKEYKIWSCAEGDPILKSHQVDELINRIQQYEKNH